jgi:hypothetical protein
MRSLVVFGLHAWQIHFSCGVLKESGGEDDFGREFFDGPIWREADGNSALRSAYIPLWPSSSSTMVSFGPILPGSLGLLLVFQYCFLPFEGLYL